MKLVKVFLALVLVALTGCASIVSKSDWPVAITSSENGVPFTVKNEDGISVASGKTPSTITLASGNGYFDGADYTITTPGGIMPLTSRLNGWYFGNFLFGGLIGMAIVDPLTGAMWKLPAVVQVSGGVSP